MKNNIIIRVASTEDAQTLLEIYRPYVEHTAITFEYDVPGRCSGRVRVCQPVP